MALITPTGRFLDFELTTAAGSGALGELWVAEFGTGTLDTVHVGTEASDGGLVFTAPGSSADSTIDSFLWSEQASGSRQPAFFDIDPFDLANIDAIPLTASVYIWHNSALIVVDVADATNLNNGRVDWQSVVVGAARPSTLGLGSAVRILFADTGQDTVVSNFVQGHWHAGRCFYFQRQQPHRRLHGYQHRRHAHLVAVGLRRRQLVNSAEPVSHLRQRRNPHSNPHGHEQRRLHNGQRQRHGTLRRQTSRQTRPQCQTRTRLLAAPSALPWP